MRSLAPTICSLVLGVKYGFQPSPETTLYARDRLPEGTTFTAFGIGRWAFPMVAQSVLAGGHARIGLEDAVYMSKDVFAKSNAEMVEKSPSDRRAFGAQIATPRKLAIPSVCRPALLSAYQFYRLPFTNRLMNNTGSAISSIKVETAVMVGSSDMRSSVNIKLWQVS